MIRLRRGNVPLVGSTSGANSETTAPPSSTIARARRRVGPRIQPPVAAADDRDRASAGVDRRGVGSAIDAEREARDDRGTGRRSGRPRRARPVRGRRSSPGACRRRRPRGRARAPRRRPGRTAGAAAARSPRRRDRVGRVVDGHDAQPEGVDPGQDPGCVRCRRRDRGRRRPGSAHVVGARRRGSTSADAATSARGRPARRPPRGSAVRSRTGREQDREPDRAQPDDRRRGRPTRRARAVRGRRGIAAAPAPPTAADDRRLATPSTSAGPQLARAARVRGAVPERAASSRCSLADRLVAAEVGDRPGDPQEPLRAAAAGRLELREAGRPGAAAAASRRACRPQRRPGQPAVHRPVRRATRASDRPRGHDPRADHRGGLRAPARP